MAQFATADELGDLLGRTFAVGAELDQANMVLELASAFIQGWIRQTLVLVNNDVVRLTGRWDEYLELPQRPVVAVDLVKVDGTSLAATGDWELLGTALWRSTAWAGPQVVVEVTYDHGYAVIPDDIVAVCLQLAARMLGNPAGVRQESIGTYSVAYGGDITGGFLNDADKTILRRYRRTAASVPIR